jgi:hypothetical protein
MRIATAIEAYLIWWVTAASFGADRIPEYTAALLRWNERCALRQSFASAPPCPISQELFFPVVPTIPNWRQSRSNPPFANITNVFRG